MGCERLLARSTGKAGKQARRWLSPVEDVIALPSTQALPLTFKLWKHDIRGLSQASPSRLSATVPNAYIKMSSTTNSWLVSTSFGFAFVYRYQIFGHGETFLSTSPISFSMIILQFTFFQMINAASNTIMELNKPQTSWHRAGFNAAFPKHWK